MSRRRMLGVGLVAVAAAGNTVMRGVPTAAPRPDVTAGKPDRLVFLPDPERLIFLPCPVWCEQDHSWSGVLTRDEAVLKERYHSTCVGGAGVACVELVRTDDLLTGEAGPVKVFAGIDEDLTADNAAALASLLQLAAAVLRGQMSLIDARRAAPQPGHERERCNPPTR